MNQSMIEARQYGFTTWVPPAETTDPLTTSETAYTTVESVKLDAATLDIISVTFWLLLCCILFLIAAIMLLIAMFMGR